MSFGQSDFSDDIVQDELPVHTGPPVRGFLPWHKVRKEFIRKHQWNRIIKDMIRKDWKRQAKHGINCLVIPGDDLLDVRAMLRDTVGLDCTFRYLGFNQRGGSDKFGTKLYIANNDVVADAWVSKESRVVHDSFESVAKPNSQANEHMKNHGPYHVVNLDLCGSILPNNESPRWHEYYPALYRLVEYQFDRQLDPWLLFVTTVVKPGPVDTEQMAQLCQPMIENRNRHHSFSERLGEMVPMETFGADGVGQRMLTSGLTGQQMTRLFSVAFGKYLLQLSNSNKPRWTVAMRDIYEYSINEEKEAIMISAAFCFSREAKSPHDTTGLGGAAAPLERFPSELESAMGLLDGVSKMEDVDQKLRSDHPLWLSLRDSKAALMKIAGYDPDSYLTWVENGERL